MSGEKHVKEELKEEKNVMKNVADIYTVRINTEIGHTNTYFENIELRNAN